MLNLMQIDGIKLPRKKGKTFRMTGHRSFFPYFYRAFTLRQFIAQTLPRNILDRFMNAS